MDLGPLLKEEALSLAGAFIDATQRVALACIERAEGNPLFLEQCCGTPRRGRARRSRPAIFPGPRLGQQRFDRGADIPHQPQVEARASAQILGPKIYLRDLGVDGIELSVRKVGAEHKQRVAIEHGMSPKQRAASWPVSQ
jgi:hypothetical protein